MTQILPGILEKTFSGVQEKAARLRGIVDMAQLDVTDGVFVPEESWHEPADLNKLETEIKFDLHLMVDRPEQWIEQWDHELIKRFTYHYEATYDVRRTMELVKKTGKQVGVALNLETPVSAISDVADELDIVLFMAITPGGQGRPFDPKVLLKIAELRAQHPNVAVGVDGGINGMTAPQLLAAGVDMMVSGSFLFGQEDIAAGIRQLQGVER